MVVDIIAIVLGASALIIGLIGCVAPIIPGPVVGFAGLLLISIAGGFTLMPLWLFLLLGVLAVGIVLLDNFLPALASKRAGAGPGGVWGSIIGMLIGAIVFPPFGLIIGAFIGALAGEMLFPKGQRDPWRAALAVFTGTMLGIVLKLLVTGVIGYYFVRGSIALL
jgi:hypothetical protein